MNADFFKHLVVNPCGKVYCKPDWRWDCETEVTFNDFDLWVIVSGKGTLQTPEKRYQLGTGNCFILNKQTCFIGSSDPDFPLVVIYVHFDFRDESGVRLSPPDFQFFRNMNNFPFFVQLLERVLMLKFNQRHGEAAHWLWTALLEVKYQDEQLAAAANDSEGIAYVKKLCQVIREHPEQRFSLNAAARKVFYSTGHFARLFKEHAGMSFSNYILRSRMDAANLYLVSTSYSIGRIAELLGYDDIYFFSRQFKKVQGKSPRAWRKIAH